MYTHIAPCLFLKSFRQLVDSLWNWGFTSPPPRAYALPLAIGNSCFVSTVLGSYLGTIFLVMSLFTNVHSYAPSTSCGARAYMMKLTLVAERQSTFIFPLLIVTSHIGSSNILSSSILSFVGRLLPTVVSIVVVQSPLVLQQSHFPGYYPGDPPMEFLHPILLLGNLLVTHHGEFPGTFECN
ncbi:hypothetical protein Tco_0336929 [Tanacetum coccineum]